MAQAVDRESAGFGAVGRLRGVRVDADVIAAQFGHPQSVGSARSTFGRHDRRHAGALERAQVTRREIGMLCKGFPLLWPTERDGCAMKLDQLERLGRVK